MPAIKLNKCKLFKTPLLESIQFEVQKKHMATHVSYYVQQDYMLSNLEIPK